MHLPGNLLEEEDLGSISSTCLCAAFMLAHRSQKLKKLLNLTVFLALLGSVFVKAASKLLVKLTPGGNLTEILQAAFRTKVLFAVFLYLQILYVFFYFWQKEIVKKAAVKC